MAATPGFAQEPDQRAPFRMPPLGAALRISNVEDIPPQLKSAVERLCRPDDLTNWMKMGLPVEIFRPANGYRPMALVPCGHISAFHLVFMFDRNPRAEPSLMLLPVVARGGGFTASEQIGRMTWDPTAKLLIATRSSDLVGEPIARHTYQHVGGELNGFALVKAEIGKQGFNGGEDWRTLWEARPWELSGKP